MKNQSRKLQGAACVEAISAKSPTAMMPKLLSLLGLMTLLSATGAQAANFLWSNAPTDGTWSGAANWTNGSAPIAGSSLEFTNTSVSVLTNDILAGTSFAGITFDTNASAYTIGGNSFTLAGNIVNNGTSTQTINNAITLSSASHTFTATSGQLVFGGNISGTINGSPTIAFATNKVTFAGTNSIVFTTGTFLAALISGPTDITGSTTLDGGSGQNNGGFVVDNNIGAGKTATVTIANGGSFIVNGNTLTASNTVPNSLVGQQTGTGVINVGATDKSSSGTFTVGAGTGLVFGNSGGNGTLNVNSGTATINRGTVANSSTFTDTRLIMMGKDNAGSTGTINLNGGTLATDRQFVRDGSTAAGSGIANFVFNGGTLKALTNQLDWLQSGTATSANQGGGTVNGAALALSSVTTTAVSTIDANGFSVTLSNAISGAGGFIITNSSGSGTVTFGGAKTYTGATTISAGTLALTTNASLTSTNIALASGTFYLSTNFALAAAQTLSGSGNVVLTNGGTFTLTNNGTLSPGVAGVSRGLINVNGNLTLGSASTNRFTITQAGTAGTDYDAVGVTNALAFNGLMNLVYNGGIVPVGTFNLFSAGSYSGNFTNVALSGSWASAAFTNAGGVWSWADSQQSWSLSTLNGALTVSAVPEPSAWALFGLSGLVLVVAFRRRTS